MSSTHLDNVKEYVSQKSVKLYHKLLEKSNIKIPHDNSQKQSLKSRIFTMLFVILWNGLILHYLYNLEDPNCNCIKDWRHNYLKTISYINIIMIFIPVILPLIIIDIKFNKLFTIVIGIIIIVLNAVYIYALYTYVDDLNVANCACTINQTKINYLLNHEKNIGLALYIIGIITVVTEIELGFTFNFRNKKYDMKI